MSYTIVESIKGDAVRRQLETLESSLEQVLTVDVEAGQATDESKVDLTPTITIEAFRDTSEWDVEYAFVLRVGSDPYRFVWLKGDAASFFDVAVNDIDADLNGIQTLRVIDGSEEFVAAVSSLEYDVVGISGTEANR